MSYVIFFLVKSWKEILTSQLLFQNTYVLRKPRVVHFADISEIETILLKKSLKTKKKYEELKISYLNTIYICIS